MISLLLCILNMITIYYSMTCIQDGGYYDILVQIIDLLRSNYSDRVWGVIGPGDDPRVADFIAPMNENAGLMTVRPVDSV